MGLAMATELRLQEESPLPPLDGEIVEISLLLPGWQASRLEHEASSQGLTAAQMMRRLLRSYLEAV
jgi:hypothetical protein